jgi:hypothetical protein
VPSRRAWAADSAFPSGHAAVAVVVLAQPGAGHGATALVDNQVTNAHQWPSEPPDLFSYRKNTPYWSGVQ